MARRGPYVALVLLALAIRIGWILLTPHYALVHDAVDYDRHAAHIVQFGSFETSYSRKTAFRPPAFIWLLSGAYWVFGDGEHRVELARIVNALVGTGIVALIGVLARMLWGRREALVAMALAAVYVPLLEVGQAVMSEPLFALLMLAAMVCALNRWVVLTGVLFGLAVLARANGLILALPLAWALWEGRARWWRPALMLVLAALCVIPWTIRNQLVLGHFVPVSTQFGSAMAGTYNDQAQHDPENPASWRALAHIPLMRERYIGHIRRTNEAVLDQQLRAYAIDYIKDHPTSVVKTAWWTSRRMLDLGGLDWSVHTASTISVGKTVAKVGVYVFWLFFVLAVIGAFDPRARAAPRWVWTVPLLMYLSVVFLVVETPRYRTALDPFFILLAALAVTRFWSGREISRASRAAKV
jgi:4-amino-4-deoxy-L-arabinose transferase-like glycosyltransferase